MERLVIYRLGSLGDTIVALPFFNRIAQLYPAHERIMLTNIPVSAKAAPLAAVLGSELVHGAISYPVGSRNPTQLWALRNRLRALDTSTMIYLMPSRGLMNIYRDVAFFKLCGFRTILGVPWTSDLDTCRIDTATGVEEPECERLARAMRKLGPFDLQDPAAWDLGLTAEETAGGRRVLEAFGDKPFIAINMGGKAVQKDWGEANWRELLTELAGRCAGHGLLVVGAGEDSERARSVGASWTGRVVDACGRLSPRESAAALAPARLFIGHDSGPLHLANVAGVRCLGLFGDFNRPRKWHPYIGTNRIIHDMRGVGAITVNEVISAATELLA